MENYPEIFEEFIKKYPFKGEIHMYYYSQLMNDKPNLEDFHNLKSWCKQNINGLAKDILHRNQSIVDHLNIEHSQRWKKERDHVKLMVPTIKSLEKAIGMFDND
ncbi:MAG: hypothetical protein IPL31_10475 [Saprospiraceae bacterium]|nr:hypothetical protein [Saprospiraceae bacterium]